MAAPTPVDGTSVASPLMAGGMSTVTTMSSSIDERLLTLTVLTLVNDALIAKGKPTLGFLNPMLYSGFGTSGFNDIVTGSSTGCNR